MLKIDVPWVEWVATNKIKGASVASILLAMANAGVDENEALRLVSNIEKLPLYALLKQAEGEKLKLQKELKKAQQSVFTNTEPMPYLSQEQFSGNINGHNICISFRMSSPNICVVNNFISESEQKFLLDIANTKLKLSTVVNDETGVSVTHPNRTSFGMSFQRSENNVITAIEERISKFVQWPVENGEGVQILKYDVGQEYKPHYDYFNSSQSGSAAYIKNGGQRVATLIMYLSTPEEGGFTEFPNLNLRFPALAGSAIFFSYPDATKTDTLHGGTPVLKGAKYIATKWLREKRYD
jgi:prolyl 4-hydroxylase